MSDYEEEDYGQEDYDDDYGGDDADDPEVELENQYYTAEGKSITHTRIDKIEEQKLFEDSTNHILYFLLWGMITR
jgi:hypothetical protein